MNPDITRVHVDLSERGYEIEIGVDVLPTIGTFIADRVKISHAVIITDTNVVAHAEVVRHSVERSGAKVDLLTVSAGEASKNVGEAERLWKELLARGADRKTLVIAVGGGVIGDLAGFVAATYGRGIAFVQVPTTLLADVDSSVGGKVGVNLPGAKNIVGAFWQPRGVLIDINVLKTLPDREYRSGLAEVVKYGVILDADFFSYLESNIDGLNNRTPEVLQFVVARCCRLKADVVQADEREESGLRAVLNYGHTFCHAFEAVTGYNELLHGEAVSIGMLCASRLSEKLGRVDEQFTRRQKNLLTALGLPTVPPDANSDELVEAMRRDKKNEHGELRFVLPTRMGHVELVGGVDPALARSVLSAD